MKAVRKISEGPGNLDYVDIPEPTLGQGEVKIKIHSCGICGSDMKFYHWTMRPGLRIPVPVTFGHEYSGEIVEIGENVTGYKVGDRVTSETQKIVCGKCEQCRSGHFALCAEKRSIGYQTDGAFAEFICMREELLHRVPENVTLEEAAMAEPSCVAFHAVFDLGRVNPGDTVVIFGPGTIGQIVGQLAKSASAQVILIGMSADKERLDVGKNLCADNVFEADKDDIVKEIRGITNGRGADCVFECSGSGTAFDQAILSLKKQGILVGVALYKTGSIPINNLNTVVNNEIQIRGAYAHRPHNWDRVLRLMSNRQLNLLPLITHRYDLSQWKEGFTVAEQMHGIKVLLKP
jgi:L-iditol 2-dehydrogenase